MATSTRFAGSAGVFAAHQHRRPQCAEQGQLQQLPSQNKPPPIRRFRTGAAWRKPRWPTSRQKNATACSTITRTRQTQYGFSGQFTLQDTGNQFTAGPGYDASRVRFSQTSQFGYLNPDRSVTPVNFFADGTKSTTAACRWTPGEPERAHPHLEPVRHRHADPGRALAPHPCRRAGTKPA